jgi:cobyrinic acid a,c-diamide synthase
MNGFLIAGTASGVGKTTVSLSILAALRRRGLAVQPFKGGPDFLDTGHLARISGRTARNVDTWMLSPEENLKLVQDASRDADTLLVEGMMGLFDGKSGDSEVGSSAEIAKLLKLPVVLVLDAGKSARSLAAVVLGFEMFDPNLNLAGIILNRVASARHFALLESAIKSACRTPILGWLPRDPTIAIPERHLGLRTAEESIAEDIAHEIDTLASLAEKHLNLHALTALTCGLQFPAPDVARLPSETPVRIGVARDAAFSFYYEDNLDLLREQGAIIVPFSPIHDASLPPSLDALYFGGGYPELYAAQLSANNSMLADVRDFAASNKPIYAECGGMIYLGSELTTDEAPAHKMADVLPIKAEMTNNLSQFGYVTVEFTHDCLLGPAGSVVRGHSFHYSRLTEIGPIQTSYRLQYSLSGKEEAEGFSTGNVLASYIHLHFRAAPLIAEHFVQVARQVQAAQWVSA